MRPPDDDRTHSLDQTNDPQAYAAWGRALAALHHAPTAGAIAAPLPWVLPRVPRASETADGALKALLAVELGIGSARTGVADVVAWVSSSDLLTWALESTAAAWSARAWIPSLFRSSLGLDSSPALQGPRWQSPPLQGC